MLPSICAVISLITFFAVPDTFVYITFYYLIGRRAYLSNIERTRDGLTVYHSSVYTNSLLATLNARKSLREGASGVEMSLSLRDGHADNPAHIFPVSSNPVLQ